MVDVCHGVSRALGRCLVIGLMALVALGRAGAQDVEHVAGSTVPRVQLTGEHFQISAGGRYFTDTVPGQTLSRYGVQGTDLGLPIVLPDKILLIFGDTIGAVSRSGRYTVSRGGPNNASDAIGYISAGDFQGCNYLSQVRSQLLAGTARPNASLAGCPTIRFHLNPTRSADQHLFKPIVISGLLGDENLGTLRVPTAGLMSNDRLYLFFITRHQEDGRHRTSLQSIVARSDQAVSSWSDTNPPTFTRLFTLSTHAPVLDLANPPPELGEGGKFMFTPNVTLDARTIAALPFGAGLPPALKSAQNVVFVWGGSWRVPRSNLYLAAFPLADLESGPSRWHYYAGGNQWSSQEKDAAPLLATDTLAEFSVLWNSALGRFVLMRGEGGNIVAQFATAPWGPWSNPVSLLSPSDPWAAALMHRPGQDQIVQSLVPLDLADGTPATLNQDPGVAYSPNLIDRFTRNADGSVTLYYTLSTWNPYQVFLVSSSFRLAAPAAPTGLAAVVAGSSVTLTWTAPPGGPPASYVIEAGSAPGLADLANFDTGSAATTFLASGVPPATYHTRVRAARDGATGAPSNEAVITVGPVCTSPGAPANLRVVVNAAGTVTLTWLASSGSPTHYLIEAGTAPGLANLVPGNDVGAQTSFTARGVARGIYYVRLRAGNACGTSAASNEVVVTVR